MFSFLLVLHAIVSAAMVGVILMQRSEGGGLVGGGSASGLMTARGAADLLTRTTTVLVTIFIALSIALAGVASLRNKPVDIDTSLAKPVTPAAPPPVVPLAGDSNAAAPVAAVPSAVQERAVPQATTEAPKAKVTKVEDKPKSTDTRATAPKAVEKVAPPVAVVPTVTPPTENATQ